MKFGLPLYRLPIFLFLSMITDKQDTAMAGVQNRTLYFFALLKFRLSALVVFSGVFGYLLASPAQWHIEKLLALIVGSFLVTGGANTINQIMERELDKLMKRTQNRPLPLQVISVQEAGVFAILLSGLGLITLALFVNTLTAGLSLLSLLLYAFFYTPMKQISPVAVAVGAIPGALPPLIGWVAATGQITSAACILFMIQFIWQFPHFWAIAWVADQDYRRAGFKLLPSKHGKDRISAIQIILYTCFLIPAGILPAYYGLTGKYSAVIAVIAALCFVWTTIPLLKSGHDKAAKGVMFTSFIYLPLVQIAFLLDKSP